MNDLKEKQLSAWGICAMSFIGVFLLPQTGWMATTILSVGTLVVVLVGNSMATDSEGKVERYLGIPIFIWNIIMMSKVGREISVLHGTDSILPGLLLLFLGYYGFRKGVMPVVGTVLLFFIGAVYGMIYLFSVSNIAPENLIPTGKLNLGNTVYGLCPILLLYMYGGESRKYRIPTMALIGLTALGAAVITAGMGVADFYTASMSVTLFGTMERLEPFVACAGTVGAFCLMGLLLSVNENLWKKMMIEKKKYPALEIFLLSTVGLLLIPYIGDRIMTAGTTLCWGLAPVLTQLVVSGKNIRKKSKKLKKTLDKWEDIC